MFCSTSELPGIFVERQHADCAVFYAKRTGFWRSEIYCKRMDCKTIEDVTIAGNDWLEEKLKSDEIARYDWLWLHRRWRMNHENSRQLSVPMAKSILDAGWFMLKTQLEYKAIARSVVFEVVNESYSTQACSCCGAISANSPKGRAGLRIRERTCCECGTTHDRDVNAAKNILAAGHRRLAVGIPFL